VWAGASVRRVKVVAVAGGGGEMREAQSTNGSGSECVCAGC
jgi:hypothetical protein